MTRTIRVQRYSSSLQANKKEDGFGRPFCVVSFAKCDFIPIQNYQNRVIIRVWQGATPNKRKGEKEMKTITLGNANAGGYNVVGEYDGMPLAVKRLAERDIKIVVASDEFLSMYDENEIEILENTISRYGARLEREEN